MNTKSKQQLESEIDEVLVDMTNICNDCEHPGCLAQLKAGRKQIMQAFDTFTKEAVERAVREALSEPPTYKAKTPDGRDVEGYYVKHINATPYPIASKEEHQKFLDEHTEHVIMMDDFSDWGLPRNAKPYRIDINTLQSTQRSES